MVDIADKLAEARKLIERGWTQGQYARGKSGKAVDEHGRHAVCFCALGALRRATGNYWDNGPETRLLRSAIGSKKDVIDWNDAKRRTQAQVIEAFKRAEQIAREQVRS
jgi:hypothetical protein